jgi:hypothetical protein
MSWKEGRPHLIVLMLEGTVEAYGGEVRYRKRTAFRDAVFSETWRALRTIKNEE